MAGLQWRTHNIVSWGQAMDDLEATFAERGAVLALLDHQWVHGRLPESLIAMKAILEGIGASTRMFAGKRPEINVDKISALFPVGQDGWRRNQLLAAERVRGKQRSESARERGRLGAEKRYRKSYNEPMPSAPTAEGTELPHVERSTASEPPSAIATEEEPEPTVYDITQYRTG